MSEFARAIEQRPRRGVRHLALEEAVDLGLILHYQRGKKVVSASSGNTTRLQPWLFAWRSRSRMQARDRLGAAFSARDRAELGGADGDDAGHGSIIPFNSPARRTSPPAPRHRQYASPPETQDARGTMPSQR